MGTRPFISLRLPVWVLPVHLLAAINPAPQHDQGVAKVAAVENLDGCIGLQFLDVRQPARHHEPASVVEKSERACLPSAPNHNLVSGFAVLRALQ